MSADASGTIVKTRIPARLDRLPWSSFHWMIIIGLGTVWILDGLEATVVGAIGARLTDAAALGLSDSQVTTSGSIYLVGACSGALFWGYLTDRLGRKKLFLITLALYVAATVFTAFTWSFASFAVARFLTGFGIGGEYAAINSAIDELIPARARGFVDLAINGSYWMGATIGYAGAVLVLDTSILSSNLGWRLAFGAGAILGLCILFVRRNVPESPRWLVIHGHEDEAERTVDGIEDRVRASIGTQDLPEPEGDAIEIEQRRSTGFGEIARTVFGRYPRRAYLSFILLSTQAFLYNAVTFTASLLLTDLFGVSDSTAPAYLIPWALSNFLGALLLGRLFDTIGRKPMIAGCYGVSAVVLAVLAILVGREAIGVWGFVGLLALAFFIASAAASAGYLTVSEIFPMETRAMAIAFFYAISTGIGGVVGPVVFGTILGTKPHGVMIGFLIAAGLMLVAAVSELVFGVAAEGESLEEVAEPLSAEAAESS
jgi:MFS family permease